MYHIKSDRRSQHTAEAISRGLLECLREKPLNAITISDIHRITGISRATFYRLFDTVEDVLDWLCAQPVPEEEQMILKRDQGNPHRVYNRMLELGLENHDLLKALVDNGRYDLVYRYAEQRFRLMSSLYPGNLPELDEAAYDYTISAMAMNMVATLVTWVRRGRIDSPEEVAFHSRWYMKIMASLMEEPEDIS